ncbi:MAG: transcriptional regulator [Candidatus Woesearchaeota archaeon]|nr:transcriptional regulator [Candidatus Woesearchaeota archaeon]
MEKNAGRRKFSDLREIILKSLVSGQKTINQISSETGINWKTVDNHLIYLVGKGFAREVFSSRFARIFEITEKGVAFLQGNNAKNIFQQNREVKLSQS